MRRFSSFSPKLLLFVVWRSKWTGVVALSLCSGSGRDWFCALSGECYRFLEVHPQSLRDPDLYWCEAVVAEGKRFYVLLSPLGIGLFVVDLNDLHSLKECRLNLFLNPVTSIEMRVKIASQRLDFVNLHSFKGHFCVTNVTQKWRKSFADKAYKPGLGPGGR